MTETPQPPDPYGHGSGTSPETGDVPSGIGDAETIGSEPPRNGKGRGVVIGSAAAVLAIAAGAAVWATTTLSGGGRQPDEVVPKTTFAYMKVDLDPAANQKLAARSFFSKFPDLKDKVGGEADNVFDNLLAEAISDESLDYRTDIQPWFDKRMAIAAFTEGSETHVVAALRSKDDAQAKESLDKAIAEARADGDDSMSYQLTNGYAVLGDTDGVTAAVRLAEKETLSDNETYQDDVDRLDGDQVAVGWADVAQVFQTVTEEAGIVAIPPALAGQAKGRVVSGLHFSGDAAEVSGLFLGGDPAVFDVPAGQDLLTGLPADTGIAVSLNGFGKMAGDSLAGLPIDDFLEEYLGGADLSVTGDVLPLLMKQTVLAVSPFSGFEDLQAGLVSKVDDATKARATAAKIEAALGAMGVPATAGVEGDTFVLAMPAAYGAELVKGNGGLGAKPGFTKAMGDLDDVTQALYVDATAMRDVAPWVFGVFPEGTTFGAVSGARDGEGFFRMRLVVD